MEKRRKGEMINHLLVIVDIISAALLSSINTEFRPSKINMK